MNGNTRCQKYKTMYYRLCNLKARIKLLINVKYLADMWTELSSEFTKKSMFYVLHILQFIRI